jgi:ABC transporter
VERTQPALPCRPAPRLRCRRRYRRFVTRPKNDAAVIDARSRRLPGHGRGGFVGCHHRLVDHACACALAGRHRDRQLARLHVGPPELRGTRIGEGGTALSAGQRQLVGLARALYGDPFLVVLDEPNSNLDADGDDALAKAIQAVRNRSGIVIVVAHRPSALANLDYVMAMAGGTMQAFGRKSEVLGRVLRPEGPQSVPAEKQGEGTVVPLHEMR